MKLTKTEQWILSHQTENGTLQLPNARKASRDAVKSLERKGLAVYGIRVRKQGDINWAGWWPTEAGKKATC